jgi:predicted metal-binding protein
MDNLGHIFYVTYHDGLCQIQEVNPFGDNDPICVYQIKTEECFGMCVNGHKIFFMNDNHSIFMFERLKDQKALLEIKELFIKDKDM